MNHGSKTVAIFVEAFENRRHEEWAQFLDQACQGDALLRERVSALLCAQQPKDDWVDRLGLECAETDGEGIDGVAAEGDLRSGLSAGSGDSRRAPGRVIGPYQLLKQIGEGGMGLVF